MSLGDKTKEDIKGSGDELLAHIQYILNDPGNKRVEFLPHLYLIQLEF
jgi:hypothetical protein